MQSVHASSLLEMEIECPMPNRDSPDFLQIEIAFYFSRFSILNRDRDQNIELIVIFL